MKTVYKTAKYLLVVGFISLVVTEVLLKIFFPLQSLDEERTECEFSPFLPTWNVFGKSPPFRAVFRGGSLIGIRETEAEYYVNRYGFLYDEKKASQPKYPNEVRIAILGGSTVECIALNEEDRWPTLVESFLSDLFDGVKFTVYNLGVSGQDTRTHMASLVQHAVKLDIDYAIFMLGANDLTRMSEGFDEKGWAVIKRREGRSLKLLLKSFLLLTEVGKRAILLRRFLLYGNSNGLLNAEVDTFPPYFAGVSNKLVTAPLLPDSLVEIRLSRLENSLDDYSINIKSLAGICVIHDIVPIFTTQPMLWKQEMSLKEKEVDWLGRAEIGGQLYRVPSHVSAKALEMLNKQLIETCIQEDFLYIDVCDMIPRNLDHFYDSVHFNEKGAREVAKVVTAFLADLIWDEISNEN